MRDLKKQKQKYLDKIHRILGKYFSDMHIENVKDTSFEIATTSEITFDKLQKIVDLFNTKNININSETRHTGGCDTCAYNYSVNILFVKDVTWPSLGTVRSKNFLAFPL